MHKSRFTSSLDSAIKHCYSASFATYRMSRIHVNFILRSARSLLPPSSLSRKEPHYIPKKTKQAPCCFEGSALLCSASTNPRALLNRTTCLIVHWPPNYIRYKPLIYLYLYLILASLPPFFVSNYSQQLYLEKSQIQSAPYLWRSCDIVDFAAWTIPGLKMYV